MTFGEVIDLHLGSLAREGRRPSTLSGYRRLLNHFADQVHDKDVADLVLLDYERFLDRWTSSEPSTLASQVSLVRGFSRFLFERGLAATDVAYPLKRPRKKPPEDLNVISLSSDEAGQLLETCADWQEFLCVATGLYTGARRGALNRARLRDVDFRAGTIRFFEEKGGKSIVKPMPDEYVAILRSAQDYGIWAAPQNYLIPSRRPAAVRRAERSDKVIWNTVKRVAARAGLEAHVHALRGACAVKMDEAKPGEIVGIKEYLGHSRLETTLVYLRRKDKARAMESVARGLSFGSSVFPSKAEEAHTGFEPVPPP